MPFGVELLQLHMTLQEVNEVKRKVTSAFRRGASSAGSALCDSCLRSSIESPVPFGVELLQLQAHYADADKNVFGSPVPFGVELLQL